MSKEQDNFEASVGAASNGCGAPSPAPQPATAAAPTAFVPLELHACMGLNACKGHDRFGTNACAGMGMCATTAHVCHSLNNCRGQGGCGLYGSAEEQNQPGQNDCAWKGSCATPIQAERFSTQGPNKEKSVWKRARELFADRMAREGREIGEPRFKEGPPTWWLKSLGPFDGCGSSGDPNCSFGGGGTVLCKTASGKPASESAPAVVAGKAAAPAKPAKASAKAPATKSSSGKAKR